MSETTLEFFFDFSSPFSYLAATQVEDITKRCRARLVWRPFLLGGLFKTIGQVDTPLMSMHQSKQRHMFADLFRWADHWGVGFKWPTRFPMRTILPLRVAIAAGDAMPAFVHAAYDAYWVEDRDIADENEVRAIAKAVGLPDSVVARTSDQAVKDALKQNTDEAASRGAFGAPTFFVTQPGHDEPLLFWGQDRFSLVEKALGGWRPHVG